MSDRLNKELRVLYRERPWTVAPSQLFIHSVEEGMTLEEIIQDVFKQRGLQRGLFDARGVVLIGDDLVPKYDENGIYLWNRIRPKARADGVVPVRLGLRLSGGGSSGGGGGKSTFMTIATIAVLAATLFVGGGGLTLLGAGSTFAAGHIGAALAAGAISIAGSLAIAGLTPPPAKAASLGTIQTPQAQTAPKQGTASLSGNSIGPGDPVSRCWGTHDVNPEMLVNPLREIVGLDEYVECVYGLNGAHAISNVRIDNVPIDILPDVTYQVVEGKPTDSAQTLIQRQSYTVEPRINLSRPQNDPTTQINLLNQSTPANSLPQWYGFVTEQSPDEFWIILAWQSGLSKISGSGYTNVAVPVRVRIRRKGSTQWINLPEFHFDSKSGAALVKHIKFFWSAKPLAYPQAPPDEGPYLAISSVPIQTISPTSGGWTADPYFNSGAGTVYSSSTFNTHTMQGISLNSDGVEVFLDPATFPQDFYEVQIITGSIYTVGNFVSSTYKLSGTVYDFFGYWLNSTTAEFPETRAAVQDNIAIARFSSVWNSIPTPTNDFATISIKAKNQTIGQLTCTASGYVYDWNGSEWANFTTTSNPAAHLIDAWTRQIRKPIPFEIIDNTSIVAWRTHCINNNFTVNMVTKGLTLGDVQQAIAAAGYARVRNSDQWSVVYEHNRSADGMVTFFSPRNCTAQSFQKAFPDIPTGLRVSFDDKFNNYKTTEIIVLRSGVVDDGVYEQIRYDTIDNETDAITRATFDLGQMVYRPAFWKNTAKLDFITCTKGDLVGLQTDVVDQQSGSAYIDTVTYDGSGNVIGLVLDGTIPSKANDQWESTSAAAQWSSFSSQWATARYGVQIRQLDQTLAAKEINPPTSETDTITFVTPFADPGTPVLDSGCLVTTGRLTAENRRCVVLDISPKQDLTADLTLIDEAPELVSFMV